MSAAPALESLGLSAPDGVDVAYEELLADVLLNGAPKGDRTGTGTRSLFARQLRYDLAAGFPRITTKFVAMKAVKGELLWFLKGATNIGWLTEHGITIWDEWADADGELGPVYGAQWRSWPARDGGAIDQISALIHTLRTDPDSRRMLVSAWNVSELDRMALAPCHAFFQCYAADGRLSLQVYQRSADMFLGVPFNIASYALLTHMLAQQAGLEPGELVWTGGDCHIYSNHVEQVREQLSRVPRAHPFPTLRLEKAESIDAYTMDDIDASQGYQHHPSIKAPVAV
ncbi:thymidylate synthase [Actinomyces sp. Chiba101]|uniref:Thymidylate synthase n=1 Tax=Actinomyces denticolens TaxID=52767 RepID=A0ABY1IK77_9ACTO|nr:MULTISPECIES: thymidylate synthase [Actinomyces]BAW92742.1 thymidylate synthase [Actinomyces sp. Chiba101]GAV94293.1 thymidylate synthase [Actinomyces denticolens]SHJ29131.1 thymidylate synthase [Actinomyces denticolens]SUU07307.1 Thymidylate synthase [Actinomyces denticolens]